MSNSSHDYTDICMCCKMIQINGKPHYCKEIEMSLDIRVSSTMFKSLKVWIEKFESTQKLLLSVEDVPLFMGCPHDVLSFGGRGLGQKVTKSDGGLSAEKGTKGLGAEGISQKVTSTVKEVKEGGLPKSDQK